MQVTHPSYTVAQSAGGDKVGPCQNGAGYEWLAACCVAGE